MRSRLPAIHGCSSSARGTTVLLPAPGGACSTTEGFDASALVSAGSASAIGNPDFTGAPMKSSIRFVPGNSLAMAGSISWGGSPDPHSFLGWQVELIARRHVKCRVPGIEIANRSIHAKLRRTVWVAHHQRAQPLVALERPPYLGPRQEESLVA